MIKLKRYYLLFLIMLMTPLVVSAGNIDSAIKYTWGDKLGWVNFNPDGGEVNVSSAVLSGSAWSANYGWINLNPGTAGVKNDGQGNLSGSAWSENLGWLDFTGVKIINGLFFGQATGSKAGTLNFSCDHCAVQTTWRKPGSGGSGLIAVYPTSAAVVVPVTNNQLSVSSSNYNVLVPLTGKSDVKGVSYSLSSDFTNSSILPFQDYLNINICPSGDCPAGPYEIWLKFYSVTGNSSDAQKITVNYQGAGQSASQGLNICVDDRESFLETEESRLGRVNLALSRRLSGRILLQTEDKGRAWYVYPKNLKRYYLGCPTDAFKIMRELSLGISNKNFSVLTLKDKKRLAGLILLKVEDSGRAYFINPLDLNLYYLGRPEDAHRIMRDLALGISNKNLSGLKMHEK